MRALIPILLSVALLASACSRKSAVGFRLPDGNVEKGKAAFVELKCYSCHKVDGVELPAPVVVTHQPVMIGGEVAHVQSYGELVTSIIHPSHRLSVEIKKEWEVDGKLSPMPDFNHVMTVEQMIDLVAFTQSHYKQLIPLNTYVF